MWRTHDKDRARHYALETADGDIELSKGTYLSMCRRKGVQEPASVLRSGKKITKSRGRLRPRALFQEAPTATLFKHGQPYRFKVLSQHKVFGRTDVPTLPRGQDDDVESDDDTIAKSQECLYFALATTLWRPNLLD